MNGMPGDGLLPETARRRDVVEGESSGPSDLAADLVLFVGGEPGIGHGLSAALFDEGFDVRVVPDEASARRVLAFEGDRVAVLFLSLPVEVARRSRSLAARALSINPKTTIIQCGEPGERIGDTLCSGVVCGKPCNVEAMAGMVRAVVQTDAG
jgi:hypothetical protein